VMLADGGAAFTRRLREGTATLGLLGICRLNGDTVFPSEKFRTWRGIPTHIKDDGRAASQMRGGLGANELMTAACRAN